VPPDRVHIAIVDYGAGNLRSVRRALEAVGEAPVVTDDPAVVERAEGLVLPGVGSAQDAMRALDRLGLSDPLRAYAASGRPFLGVCVGLQVLFDWSDEGGGVPCLGILPGRVKRFASDEANGLKVPHMGWNTVQFTRDDPYLAGLPSSSHFYFVHSYYAEPSDPAITLGSCAYGLDFAAIVARANVTATQFHPEKSADLGLRLYKNFANQVSGVVYAHSGH
jgi:glutamine amidotransferase